MNKHVLTHILHTKGNMEILSFKFSSNTISPPLLAYSADTNKEEPLPLRSDIATIEFHFMKRDNGLIDPYNIVMHTEKKAKVFEFMPLDKSATHDSISIISLLPGERIVAASTAVDNSKKWLCKLSFVVYEAI